MVCIPREPLGAAGRAAGRAGPEEREERGMSCQRAVATCPMLYRCAFPRNIVPHVLQMFSHHSADMNELFFLWLTSVRDISDDGGRYAGASCSSRCTGRAEG